MRKAVSSTVRQLKMLEDWFGNFFKSLPHLSDSNRELVAVSWPAMAQVFAVIQLYWAWVLWGFTRFTVPDSDFYDTIYVRYPDILSGAEKMVFYLGIVILIIQAALLLMAAPKLKKRMSVGWDLLFLSLIVNTINACVSLLITERGFASFVFGSISSIIGLYLLFEVRKKYGHVKSAEKN